MTRGVKLPIEEARERPCYRYRDVEKRREYLRRYMRERYRRKRQEKKMASFNVPRRDEK